MIFHRNWKSFLGVSIIGVLTGALCSGLDMMPYDTLWTFSSFSGSLGFWIITGMLILMQSEDRIAAGINTFLYFMMMNTSFFFVYLLLPIEFPRVGDAREAFLSSVQWIVPSLLCGIGAIVIYQAVQDTFLGTIVLSLPLGLLLCEFVEMIFTVLLNHRYLFQCIVDLTGFAFLIVLYRGKKNRILLVLCIGIVMGILLMRHMYDHSLIRY